MASSSPRVPAFLSPSFKAAATLWPSLYSCPSLYLLCIHHKVLEMGTAEQSTVLRMLVFYFTANSSLPHLNIFPVHSEHLIIFSDCHCTLKWLLQKTASYNSGVYFHTLQLLRIKHFLRTMHSYKTECG